MLNIINFIKYVFNNVLTNKNIYHNNNNKKYILISIYLSIINVHDLSTLF